MIGVGRRDARPSIQPVRLRLPVVFGRVGVCAVRGLLTPLGRILLELALMVGELDAALRG